ncbi:hypothetical protein [Nocardia aurantia]|uniref:DUF8017 domain-containing protein n=1 Tax=Nocardia aurantia TaxID=2585199 RepID=A0A7K0E1M5_9NOCA|nr:hypothetical protein [Nocardia aurantia]MQY31979.1 hypothetical protein [Nocardia aurantia]
MGEAPTKRIDRERPARAAASPGDVATEMFPARSRPPRRIDPAGYVPPAVPNPHGPHTGSYAPVRPGYQPNTGSLPVFHPNTGTLPPFSGTAPPRPEQPWSLGNVPNYVAPQPYSTGQYPAWNPPLNTGGRSRLYTGMAAVAAVLIAGITVAVIATGQHTARSEAESTGPTMISALTSDTPAPGRPGPNPPTPATAVIPGYQAVSVPARGAVYDVPKDWVVDSVGTAIWGDPPESLEIAGLTQEGKDYCPNYVRTNAFLTTSSQSDPARAANEVGMRMAKIGWSTATGARADLAEPLTSLDGQLNGSFVTVNGTAPAPAPGCAATFAIYTFAFPNENGSFVMTIAADTGVPKSVDEDTAKKILTSIRPLQSH